MECDLMIYLYVLNVALMVVKFHVKGYDKLHFRSDF